MYFVVLFFVLFLVFIIPSVVVKNISLSRVKHSTDTKRNTSLVANTYKDEKYTSNYIPVSLTYNNEKKTTFLLKHLRSVTCYLFKYVLFFSKQLVKTQRLDVEINEGL